MGRLKIYKASAGSGKTHNLTREYLRLLLKDEHAYRHILAVTFTNKATDEMKRRVLEELYKRSAVDDVAKKRLIAILHDYSSFSISTIDKFFQQTMRAFAREIGKNTSYSVELDQNMVLSEAIDQMILNLDKEESSELLDWLISFSFDSIESGKTWDVKSGINDLATQIFKEAFKIKNGEMGERLTNKSILADYKAAVEGIIKAFEKDLKDIGKRALKIMDHYNLSPDSFKGGSRSPVKYFSKISGGDVTPPSDTFRALYDDDSGWYSKAQVKADSNLVNDIQNACNDGLSKLVGEIIQMDDRWTDYNSAVEINKNIYTLGILLDINRYIQQYSKDNNIVLLSETTELLNKIIDGTDTPFIYEKVGSRIDHFMLDEFQDTSLMQWQNFKPLVQNSLASGYDNLIVGDVKQSIYRWRGSEWNLLNSDIYNDFEKEQVKEEDLNENWRSGENIVEFNNRFFTFAAQVCDSLLGESEIKVSDVYSTVEQSIPSQRSSNKGHVHLKFVDTENEDEGWRKVVMGQIPAKVDKLLQLGYRYKDIAFLVRKNDEGVEVVNYLIERGYPVISDEALLISSSKIVMNIISQLKFYNNPNDSINNTIAEFENIPLVKDESIEHLPLYEMCEKIISDLKESISGSESALVQGFLDSVLDYVKSNRSDLSSFLEWWGAKSDKLSLSSPEGQDAIRILTIHKAKGLGANVVIIPFMDLQLDHASNIKNIIWCEPKKEPFNMVPFIPIVYGKKLSETIFSSDYLLEKQKAYVDNLNTAYVALTRAKREMIVFAKKAKESKKGGDDSVKSVADILYSFYKDILDENLEADFGDWTYALDNKDTQVNEIEISDLICSPVGDRLKLSLSSPDFFDESSKRNYGLIMHDILSNVYCEEDLPKAVKATLMKGEIKESQYNSLLSRLSDLLVSVRERHWFDSTIGVYNELEIIEPGGAISRPDRVLIGKDEATVIDFKFGSKRANAHITQVSKYMNLIKKMGNVNVRGYLWYLDENQIVEVI